MNITGLDIDRSFTFHRNTQYHFHNNGKALIDIEIITDLNQIGFSDVISLGLLFKCARAE